MQAKVLEHGRAKKGVRDKDTGLSWKVVSRVYG
jgi:hypothetical protein